MVYRQVSRAFFFVSLLLTTGYVVQGYSTFQTPHGPLELTAVGAGSPRETVCGPLEEQTPCVAVPVFIKAADLIGGEHRLTVDYQVASDIVDNIRRDFGDVSPVLLRNIQRSLQAGVAHTSPQVKQASKAGLPLVSAHVPYVLNNGVEMPLKVEKKVAALAETALKLQGKKLTITSANRTPTRQAMAMKTKISLGENLRNLYANKQAINQVLYAFHAAKSQRKDPTVAMANAIKNQMDSGVYISNHLREGAVDIRTKDLTPLQKMAVLQAAAYTDGVSALDESTPPHIHLDVD